MTDIKISESLITEEENNNHGVRRTEKIVRLLNATIVDTRKENQHLKRIILDMQAQMKKYVTCLKDQLTGLHVNVEDLCKDLQFFKKEVIADAVKTNKEYTRMQKEFEAKYDFRLLEIATAGAKIENLEQKLAFAKATMQNIEKKLIRHETNEENYTHMHHRISQMNELKQKMEREITSLKNRLETANEQHKKNMAEMELIVKHERAECIRLNDEIFQLKVDIQQKQKRSEEIEAELKRQSLIAQTYAQLDREDKLKRSPCPSPALFNRPIPETPSSAHFDVNTMPTPQSPSARSTPPASIASDDPKTPVYSITPYQIKIPSNSSSRKSRETSISERGQQGAPLKRVIPLESYLKKKRSPPINIYKYL